MTGRASSLRVAARCFAADRRGAIAVTAGLGLTVMFGFAGLAVDIGFWELAKSKMQGAADNAAAAGITELLTGGNSGDIVLQSRAIAATSGYVDGTDGTTVAVHNPPSSGPNQSNESAIEVVISQKQPQLFSRLFLITAPTVEARAVAIAGATAPVCILALNPTAADTIKLAGNPTVAAPDCTIVSDSNSSSAVHLQGSASLTAATLVTPGKVAFTGNAYTLELGVPAQTGAKPVRDPYAATLTHAALTAGMPATAPCVKNGSTWFGNCVVPGGSIRNGDSLSANTQIAGGLAIKNGTVNLAPGTYWITDGDLNLQSGSGATLRCPACTTGGAGVTIILTTAKASGGTVGTLTLGSNANLKLNSPNAGNFAGDVVIQDSNGLPPGTAIHAASQAQANSSETLSGLVYFPSAAVTFQGAADAAGPQCLVLVADTIRFQGGPGLATSGCANVGLTDLAMANAGARVIE